MVEGAWRNPGDGNLIYLSNKEAKEEAEERVVKEEKKPLSRDEQRKIKRRESSFDQVKNQVAIHFRQDRGLEFTRQLGVKSAQLGNSDQSVPEQACPDGQSDQQISDSAVTFPIDRRCSAHIRSLRQTPH